MGLKQASWRVKQAVVQGKVLLSQVTPNKRMEAMNLDVSPTTVGRWCDVNRVDENMPWQMLTLHSGAADLLGLLAGEIGYTLVKVIDRSDLNGEISDERDDLIIDIGKITEEIRKAYDDRLTPGRIASYEARRISPLVSKLLVVAATMQAELNNVISEADHE